MKLKEILLLQKKCLQHFRTYMPTIWHKKSILKRKSFVILGTSGKCNFKIAIVSSKDVFKNCMTSLQNQNEN